MKFLVFLIGVVYPFFHPAPLYYFVRDFEILDQPERNLNDLSNLDFVEDKSGPAWHIYGKRLLENRRSNRVFNIKQVFCSLISIPSKYVLFNFFDYSRPLILYDF